MLILNRALILAVALAPCAGYAAQASANGTPIQTASAAAPASASVATTSSLLQPSLDELSQTVGALKMEKWKGGSVRAEASTYVTSIQHDLQATLPPLLKEADADPSSMSKVLPVSRNIDALYDVLLRVVDGARVAAPADQVGQLAQAMTDLEKSRRALDDHLDAAAAAQEKRVVDLQVSLKTQPVPVCPVTPPPPAPATPARKTVKKRKPAATAPKPANPPATTTPKPSN
jgi:hypothetical protein